MVEIETLLDRLGAEKDFELGLERIRRALAPLGNPQDAIPSIVVAGTNGKGSTSLLISSALKEAGKRVGSFLSPHLQHPKERFLCGLSSIHPLRLEKLANDFFPSAEKLGLSYFEFLMLLYFQWAREEEFDCSVLEVGLGGRLDATNVTHQLATALTSIGLDHQQLLGPTEAHILLEKLAIAPEGGRVFTSVSSPPLLALIQQEARKKHLQVYSIPEIRNQKLGWTHQSFEMDGEHFTLNNGLAVLAQNAALAYALIRKTFTEISKKTIVQGFARLHFPGRLEVVGESPRIVLSGDHNPQGTRALMQSLHRLTDQPLHFLVGIGSNKDYRSMLEQIKPLAKSLILTSPPNDTPSSEYRSEGEYIADPLEALNRQTQKLQANDTLIVTGSLYLIGHLRESLVEAPAFPTLPLHEAHP